MVDQKALFKQFYGRICSLDNGKRLGRNIYDLLCAQTLALLSYHEINHPIFRDTAFFDIILNFFMDGTQYLLPGQLLVSMTYFSDMKPSFLLKREGKLMTLNHSIVNEDGTVVTEYFNKWNSNSSLFDAIRDVVNQLQEAQGVCDDVEEEKEVIPVIPLRPNFDDNIPYNSLPKRKILGKGSFATVYESEYRGQTVAMKEWEKNVTGYEKIAFDREIDVQKRLNHPNTLTLYGVSTTPDGRPVLVLEMGDGSLTDYCTRKSKRETLTKMQKYEIIKEIALGLEYIHSLGLVHRDVKLDNILMNNGHPKIADFGLSRAIDSNSEMNITFAGSPVLFTVYHHIMYSMAPELITGERCTNLIDVYSFGCIVNEIISEETCYFDYNLRTQSIFFRDIRNGLRPTILPDTPKEVACLITDCFKNKRSRPNMISVVQRIASWDPRKW